MDIDNIQTPTTDEDIDKLKKTIRKLEDSLAETNSKLSHYIKKNE